MRTVACPCLSLGLSKVTPYPGDPRGILRLAPSEATEPVILSAAGAKDLLFPYIGRRSGRPGRRTFGAGGRDGRGPRPRAGAVRAVGGVRAGAREAAFPRAVRGTRLRDRADRRGAAALYEGGDERAVLPDAEHDTR